jgi:hypothetical protein
VAYLTTLFSYMGEILLNDGMIVKTNRKDMCMKALSSFLRICPKILE